ncbi:MAG: hypothetical protein P8X43_15680, partial [Maritimibacter sp.]
MIQSPLGGEPQPAASIRHDIENDIASYRIRVMILVAKVLLTLACRVGSIDTGTLGGDPEMPRVI